MPLKLRKKPLHWLVTTGVAFAIGIYQVHAESTSGSLTQSSDTSGCVSDNGTDGACQDGRALAGATSVTVSADGKNVYATSYDSHAITIFDRDTTTGALTQKLDTEGCISRDGTDSYGDASSATCQNGKALNYAASVTVSADGKNVYVASYGSSAIAIFDRDTTTGALTQKLGNEGCISEDGTDSYGDDSSATCQDGKALVGAVSVIVSADGKNVYAASYNSYAIAIFDRDTATGILTQKSGIAGCISEDGTDPYDSSATCQNGKALDQSTSITISADGKSVYAASYLAGAITIFNRNTTTGALTQKLGRAGCISEHRFICQNGKALDGAFSVTVSANGKNVYVASAFDSNAIAIFDRDTTTGALTQKLGTEGCISQSGTAGACQDGKALDGATSVVVSADGKNVYVASYYSYAIAIFDRDTTTGALTQKLGTEGCISEDGTDPHGSLVNCQDGKALIKALSATVSADGKNVYTASDTSSAIAIFTRAQ